MVWFDGCRVAYGMADGMSRGNVKVTDLGKPRGG